MVFLTSFLIEFIIFRDLLLLIRFKGILKISLEMLLFYLNSSFESYATIVNIS